MWLHALKLFKNSIDTQEKLRLNLHSFSVSEHLEYGRVVYKFFVCQNHRSISMSSFPRRPNTRTNFPCPKADMTCFGTWLLTLARKTWQFFAVHRANKNGLSRENCRLYRVLCTDSLLLFLSLFKTSLTICLTKHLSALVKAHYHSRKISTDRKFSDNIIENFQLQNFFPT